MSVNAFTVCLFKNRVFKQVHTLISSLLAEPGTVEFTKASNIYKESSGVAEIEIQRANGADGQIAVRWTTTDQSAIAGKDYHGGEGTIVFEHGETVKMLGIELIDDKTFEKDETFMVTLSDATNGAKVGRLRRTVVTIVNDDGKYILWCLFYLQV